MVRESNYQPTAVRESNYKPAAVRESHYQSTPVKESHYQPTVVRESNYQPTVVRESNYHQSTVRKTEAVSRPVPRSGDANNTLGSKPLRSREIPIMTEEGGIHPRVASPPGRSTAAQPTAPIQAPIKQEGRQLERLFHVVLLYQIFLINKEIQMGSVGMESHIRLKASSSIVK